MPLKVIPNINTKEIIKAPRGDIFGTLWATKNMDLVSMPGKFRLARRLKTVYDENDDADLDLPVAFLRSNANGTDKLWALTQRNGIEDSGGSIFNSDIGANPNAWEEEVGSPTDCCDNMVNFGQASGVDRLIVARDNNLAKLNNGVWIDDWWTDASELNQSTLNSDNFHYIHVFINLLLVPDGNVLHTVDDSDVVVLNRITLPDVYQIMWLADDGNDVYIGTKHRRGGKGLVFIWDGTSETYNIAREGGGNETFCGKADARGIMHVFNSLGELRQFNGDDFVPVAQLPIPETGRYWYDDFNDVSGRGRQNTNVRPNSMDLIDGNLHILLRGGFDGNDNNPEPNIPSGIWEYAPGVGLYHKYSLSTWDGNEENDYEWGTSTCHNIGALKALDDFAFPDEKFVVGATIETDDDSNEINSILLPEAPSSMGKHRGYFITSKMESKASVRAFWSRLHSLYRLMHESDHEIVLRYRVETTPNFEEVQAHDFLTFSVTWSDANTFTINDSDGSKLKVGDMVEILHGKGAGALAHITAINNTSGSNYTIEIDETLTGVSGTAKVRVMRFKKLGSISSQSIGQKIMGIVKRSKWIQLVVELRGDILSPELESLFLDFKNSKR